MPPLVLAEATLVTPVNVMAAATETGVLAKLVMVTGMAPGFDNEFVVRVVVVPEAVAVMTSFGLAWPNWRIVAALAEVAIASEASDASAKSRKDSFFITPLLKDLEPC
jgi:hypothetical protein